MRTFHPQASPRLAFAPLALLSMLAAPLLAGCSFAVPLINPSPNLALVPQAATLDLAFGPDVLEEFNLSAGITVEVQSWRESLNNGFLNGFRAAYPASTGRGPDLLLTLDLVRLEVGNFDGASARIQFAATLTSTEGPLRRTAGVATRNAAISGISAVGNSRFIADIDASIDAMYEQIARDLFSGLAPAATPALAPPVARCVPGQSIACAGAKGCAGFQVCATDGTFNPCSCGG